MTLPASCPTSPFILQSTQLGDLGSSVDALSPLSTGSSSSKRLSKRVTAGQQSVIDATAAHTAAVVKQIYAAEDASDQYIQLAEISSFTAIQIAAASAYEAIQNAAILAGGVSGTLSLAFSASC